MTGAFPQLDEFSDLSSDLHLGYCFDEGTGRLAVSLSGALDERSTGPLMTALIGVITGKPVPLATVEINLGHLDYISSTGVGSLSTVFLCSKQTGVSLVFTEVPRHIESVFRVLGMWQYFAGHTDGNAP